MGSNNPRASQQTVAGCYGSQGSWPPDSTLPGPSGSAAFKLMLALFLLWPLCRCGWEGSFVGLRTPKVCALLGALMSEKGAMPCGVSIPTRLLTVSLGDYHVGRWDTEAPVIHQAHFVEGETKVQGQ